MDFNNIKVKGFNVLVYTLMGLQIAILIGIAAILLSAISNIAVTTTISVAVMFLLGLPLLVLLYTSSADKKIKTIFLGMTADIALISVSGIIWYILADGVNSAWLIPVAKVIMVISYAPIIYALYDVLRNDHKKLSKSAGVFIVFLNLSCLLTILYYAVTHFGMGNMVDIAVYTLSTLSDIIVLALGAMLIVIYSSTRLRYILSIVFCYMLLSFIGDSLNLIDAMKLGTYGLAVYSNYFYDAMLLFLVAALLVYSFYKDMRITTVEEVDRKLDDTRHAMDDLIMQMPDATCIFNPEGEVIMVNDSFLRIFGVEREDILGKFNIFKHAGFLCCEIRDKAPLLKDGETIVVDRAEVSFPGDRLAYLSMKIFPTFCHDGAISSFISICEDVTARVRADEELKQAKALAELYIDLMGHDINNMNQVGMGYLEIALETLEVKDDKRKLLLKPLEAMVNSSRLIDNVKKLRRANDGDMYLRPIDLNKLLKDIIAEHGQAPGKEVSIRYDGGDAMVKANELLKDVFANLVSNAIKHSGGAVHINIKQETIEADGKKYYRIIVEDDGPGIPEELKPVIFDRILRRHARVGGNGIGLYLVKTLVDNFHGTISVEDRMPAERRRGTRFIVTLPAA